MTNLVPIVRADGDGEKLWFYGGGVHTWLATNAETGGAFLLFDDIMTIGIRRRPRSAQVPCLTRYRYGS